MVGAIFKIAKLFINTGTNLIAGGAVVTSTALIKGQELGKQIKQDCKNHKDKNNT